MGLDLGPHYRRAHALDLSRGANRDVIAEVLAVIAAHR